jgi:hypothetical protein
MRATVVTALEESRRLGEQVTMNVLHKELTFTGRIVRIEAGEGFAVLEHPDGRRRGLYFILGGSLKTADGREVPFPVDGVAR